MASRPSLTVMDRNVGIRLRNKVDLTVMELMVSGIPEYSRFLQVWKLSEIQRFLSILRKVLKGCECSRTLEKARIHRWVSTGHKGYCAIPYFPDSCSDLRMDVLEDINNHSSQNLSQPTVETGPKVHIAVVSCVH